MPSLTLSAVRAPVRASAASARASSARGAARAAPAPSLSIHRRGDSKIRSHHEFDGPAHAAENEHRHDDPCEIVTEDVYGPIEEVMSYAVKALSPGDRLDDIVELFEDYTGFPVVDENNRVIGVLSEKDVTIHSTTDGDRTVGEVMTTPAICIREEALIAYAAGLMLQHRVHRLPVVDKSGQLTGILSHEDLFQPLIENSADPLYTHLHLGEYSHNHN